MLCLGGPPIEPQASAYPVIALSFHPTASVYPPQLPFLVVPVSCFHLQGSSPEDLTCNPLASPRLLTALSALGSPQVTWPLSVTVWQDLGFREVKHGPEATQPD